MNIEFLSCEIFLFDIHNAMKYMIPFNNAYYMHTLRTICCLKFPCDITCAYNICCKLSFALNIYIRTALFNTNVAIESRVV